MVVAPEPASLMFTALPPLMVVMLEPFVLPRPTIFVASPMPMEMVCAPPPPIVTAPDDGPVPIVVSPAPVLLISTLPLLERASCVAEPVLNVSVPPSPVRTKRVDVIAAFPSTSVPRRY